MERMNADIRQYAFKKRIYLYEVANAMNLSYPGLMYRLRKNMTDNQKAQIVRTIDALAAKR